MPETLTGEFAETVRLGGARLAGIRVAPQMVIVPELTFELTVSGVANGSADIRVSGSDTGTESLTFDGTAWSAERDVQSSAEPQRVRFGGPTSVDVELSIAVEARLYGGRGPVLGSSNTLAVFTEMDGDPRAKIDRLSSLRVETNGARLSPAIPTANPAAAGATDEIWVIGEPTLTVSAESGLLNPYATEPGLTAPVEIIVRDAVIDQGDPNIVRWGFGDLRNQTTIATRPRSQPALPEQSAQWVAGLVLPEAAQENEQFSVVVSFNDTLLSAPLEAGPFLGLVSRQDDPRVSFASQPEVRINEGESRTYDLVLDSPARTGDVVEIRLVNSALSTPTPTFEDFEELESEFFLVPFVAGATTASFTLTATADGIGEGIEGGALDIETLSPSGIRAGPDDRASLNIWDPTVRFDDVTRVLVLEGGQAEDVSVTMSLPAVGTEFA
ncbi:MAG: hypothetical protein AAF658_17290, partial [Myxococcota bacterium]